MIYGNRWLRPNAHRALLEAKRFGRCMLQCLAKAAREQWRDRSALRTYKARRAETLDAALATAARETFGGGTAWRQDDDPRLVLMRLEFERFERVDAQAKARRAHAAREATRPKLR